MNDLKTDVCQTRCVHDAAVTLARESLPPGNELLDLADFFKVFGDHTRIRILHALYSSTELCVCDLVEVLGMNQSAVSHQLRILRASKIVKYRKDGKMVYYSLDDEHVYKLLDDGLEHVRETRPEIG
ncbi:MAG: metalloregulator ArsR/SmtB family transcription factor [Pseudomonadota bacterium]